MKEKDFNKIYEAFFKKRAQAISSGKGDLALLKMLLHDLNLKADGKEKDLLEQLVLEFSKRKLPSKVFSRYNKLAVENLISKTNKLHIEPIVQNIKLLNHNFDEVVNSLLKIASKDEYRPAMEGVFVNTAKNELVATDAQILMTIPFKLSGKSVVINPNTNLSKIDKDAALYKKKYAIIAASYPEYQRVIPHYKNHSKSFNILDFLAQIKALDKLSTFFDQQGQFVVKLMAHKQIIHLKPGLLSKLLTALAQQGTEEFQFAWADDNAREKPVLIASLQNKKMQALIMPFMLDSHDDSYAYIDFDLMVKSSKERTRTRERTRTKVKTKPALRKKPSVKRLSLKAKAIKLKLELMTL